jgi:hypothetical protein
MTGMLPRWALPLAWLLPVALLGDCARECEEIVCSPLPIAVVGVRDTAGVPVQGAFVDATDGGGQTVRVPCDVGPSTCFLGGGPGPLHLEVGAPGYRTAVRDFEVRAQETTCCGTQPVPVQLEVQLSLAL